MVIVFCADPIEAKRPDTTFRHEAEAAALLGIPWLLIDHDALERRHDVQAALRRAKAAEPGEAVYRGWMLRAEDYALLFDALAAMGIRLINSPAEYAACHWGPLAYPHLSAWMAPTAWIDAADIGNDARLAEVLAPFGAAPLVLKDWVKSQAAGYWSEACFIPSAADLDAVKRVMGRFIELQGEALVGGLVFRGWRSLARVGSEVEEWRMFSLSAKPVGCWPRFAGESAGPPPDDLLEAVAAALPSRFATADFARLAEGGWLLLEVGDGQVSGLPDRADAKALYQALFRAEVVPRP